MKERKDCKIVQDLLPNYIDKLTNEETSKYVEEHLNECEECRKILKNMQKEIEINQRPNEEKEVKYFKKYNRKLKTLITILGIVVIVFVMVVARRVVIISTLKLKEAKSFNQENIYLKTYTHSGESLSKSEIYFKDGKYKSVTKSITEDTKAKMTLYGKNGEYERYYIETEAGKFRGTGFQKIYAMTGHLQGLNFPEIIMLSIIGTVRSEKCNGVDTYFMGATNEYIDKKTGLAVKVMSGTTTKQNGETFDIVIDYKYEFGVVKDEDLVEPDASEYTLIAND